MTQRIAVVTDSTASMPADLAALHGIAVVPVQVVVGGQSHDDGTGISAADVAAALREWTPVTTSRPTPQAMLDAYEAAARGGATGVVSVHLSAAMSGTLGSALLAAPHASVPVRVVDSRTIGMALGYAAVAGARAAADGAGLDEVAADVEEQAGRTRMFFYVDTLEYLKRGGRIGAAAAVVGSALSVKPLLHLVDGRIAPLEKVRTSSRALVRLEEVAVEAAGLGPVDVAVHHLESQARADALAERLTHRLPGLQDLRVCEVGAVIGAHVGPGMLAVCVARR